MNSSERKVDLLSDEEKKRKADEKTVQRYNNLNNSFNEIVLTETTYGNQVAGFSKILEMALGSSKVDENEKIILQDMYTAMVSTLSPSPLLGLKDGYAKLDLKLKAELDKLEREYREKSIDETKKIEREIAIKKAHLENKKSALTDAMLSDNMATYLQHMELYISAYQKMTGKVLSDPKIAELIADAKLEEFKREAARGNSGAKSSILTLADCASGPFQRSLKFDLFLETIRTTLPDEAIIDPNTNEPMIDPNTNEPMKTKLDKVSDRIRDFADGANLRAYPPEPLARVIFALNAQILKLEPGKAKDIQRDLLNLHLGRDVVAQNIQNIVLKKDKLTSEESSIKKKIMSAKKRDETDAAFVVRIPTLLNAALLAKEPTSADKIIRAAVAEAEKENFKSMGLGLIKLAADLKIDTDSQKYIEKNIGEYFGSDFVKKAQTALKRASVDATGNVTKTSPDTQTAVYTPVVIPVLHERLVGVNGKGGDERIRTTIKNYKEVDKKLNDHTEKASWRDSFTRSSNLKNLEEYPNKIKFFEHLSRKLSEFEKFAPTTTEQSDNANAGKQDIRSYEEALDAKWASVNEDYQKGPYTVLDQYKDQNFYGDFTEIKQIINDIKNNDTDIARLKQLIAELENNDSYKDEHNRFDTDHYKTKYKTYGKVKEEMESQVKAIEKERQERLDSLPGKEAELTKNYQLALIAAENKKAQDIVAFKPATLLPNLNLKNEHMQNFLGAYQDDANATNRALLAYEGLYKQWDERSSKLSTAVTHYGPPVKAVNEAFEKYVGYLDRELKKTIKTISATPIMVERHHNAVLNHIYATWKVKKAEFKNPEPNKIKEQIDILKDASKIMVYLNDSQEKLAVAGNTKAYAINKAAYLRLDRVLNTDLSDLKLGVRNDKVALTEALADFRKTAEYKALPRIVRKKLKKIEKSVNDNYKKKISLFARVMGFFKPKKQDEGKVVAIKMQDMAKAPPLPPPDEQKKRYTTSGIEIPINKSLPKLPARPGEAPELPPRPGTPPKSNGMGNH